MTAVPLSSRLREATQSMHRLAERTGLMRDLLRGRAERRTYCLLLRNLHALYAALESELDRHADTPSVAPVRFAALFRTCALAEDLGHLHGAGWPGLPLTNAMESYVLRLRRISREEPATLAAHAYVRYMGDLSGGQLLRDAVDRALGLRDGNGTSFYRFAENAGMLKARFRAALDGLAADAIVADAIVAEANDAFARHVRLFEELGAGH